MNVIKINIDVEEVKSVPRTDRKLVLKAIKDVIGNVVVKSVKIDKAATAVTTVDTPVKNAAYSVVYSCDKEDDTNTVIDVSIKKND